MAKIKDMIKAFVRKHIVAEFPHPDACFECNKGSCDGCPIAKK